ncbi:ScyD/ScyE family protein [Parvularcula dongshanensis]|uniref:ScyD/ScyE family protein n=1 Tax=Parvularcula dongshanensis TaxID=1173995 RepID=A0A840I2S3_9PROT|nr:ScyD/ScyE family protein [Parvularcula dongshanensis]MBB4658635.1 hypothetical protein [Parvularcula dongshanensis]
MRSSSKPSRRHKSSGTVASLLIGGLAALGSAQAATYTIGSVVADGLANPRSVVVGPDGALWIVEAGSGGDGPSIVNGAGETVFYGTTGSVLRAMGGAAETVIADLPSLAPAGGFGGGGAHDLAFGPDGTPYVLFGFGADPNLRSAFAGQDGAELLGQLAAWDGAALVPLASLADFELTNPDGAELNSNPYGVAASGDGFVVTDAGGNSLLDVAADGTISTRAVLPEEPNPLPFGPPVYQAVPTGIALGEAGEVLVAQLTGFPFPPGGADVFAVGEDGSVSSAAAGFTNLIDVAFGADGTIFALELDSDSLIGPEMTGSLWMIDDLGVRTLLYGGFMSPTSVAIGPNGEIWVAENGLSPTDGRVVELSAVPLPGALPLMAGGLVLLALLRRRRIDHRLFAG